MNTTTKTVLVYIALWAIFIGFAGPYLISSDSTILVLTGLALALTFLYHTVERVLKWWKVYNRDINF